MSNTGKEINTNKLSLELECQDSELAFFRILFVGAGLVMAGVAEAFNLASKNTEVLYYLIAYMAMCAGYFKLIKINTMYRDSVRIAASIFDPLVVAALCSFTGEKGILLVVLFTLIPITYGFRFGEKWLVIAAFFSTASLLAMLRSKNLLTDSPLLACGVISGHILVIAYIAEVRRNYRKTQERLAEISMRDELTQLPNRRLFIEHLHHLMLTSRRSQKHIACFFIDLDGFKAVNDKLGHGVGDKVLIEVAAVMRSQLRHGDIAARLSGDEFMYATECTDDHMEIVTVAERLLHGIERITKIDGKSIFLSASIGIAFHKHEPGGRNPDPDKLVGEADKSMYEAKSAGKGQIIISKNIVP